MLLKKTKSQGLKVSRCTVCFRNFGALGFNVSKNPYNISESICSTLLTTEPPNTESQHLSHCDATRDETIASHYLPRY